MKAALNYLIPELPGTRRRGLAALALLASLSLAAIATLVLAGGMPRVAELAASVLQQSAENREWIFGGFVVLSLISQVLVMPNGSALIVAGGFALGIALRSLMIGTALSAWIRPLFFASIGAAAASLAVLADPDAAFAKTDLTPLLLAFVAGSMLLVMRLLLRLRARTSRQEAKQTKIFGGTS